MQNMEQVVFEVGGGLYPLPERQATLLAEKLRLFAQGRFPDEVRRLAAGEGWIEGARPAADVIEDNLVERRIGPIPLEGKNGRCGLPSPAHQPRITARPRSV